MRGEADDEIADAAHVDDAASASTGSTTPVSLAIKAPPPRACRAGGAMMGVADRDRERIGGVGGGARRRAAGGRPSWRPALVGVAAPITDFLTRLAAYSKTGRPARAGASRTTPRAWPSFSVDARVDVDEGLLDRRLERALRLDDGGDAVEQLAQALGQRCPWSSPGRRRAPTWRSRLPSTSITPQPVQPQTGIEADQSHRPGRFRPRSFARASSDTSKLA